jgi:hypothetical protein
MTRFATAALAPVLLFAAACDVQPDPDPGLSVQAQEGHALQRALGQLVTPPVVSGCGDIHVYAASGSDRQAIFLSVSGAYIEDAYAGGDTALEFVLPHPDVDLRVQWGTDLTIDECTDAFMGTAVVNGEATAVEGIVTIDLDLLMAKPQPWDMSSSATILLEDVVFETPSGAQRTWSVDLGTTTVGWLPG